MNAASDKHQTRALTPREAHEMEPELSLDIVGAIYCPHDGEINPIKLVFNLARNARKSGVKFLTQTSEICIRRNEAGVTGVDTQTGFIRARTVVVAAGTGTPALVKPLGT